VGQVEAGDALEPVPAAEVPPAEAPAADGASAPDAAATPDAAADPAAAAAAPEAAASQPAVAGKPHGLQPNMEVFGFREVRVDRIPPPLQAVLFDGRAEWVQEDPAFYAEEGRAPYCRLPLVYLGRFRIAAVNPGTITLAAMDELTPARIERINFREPGITWSLFEKLPADSLTAYQGMTAEQLAALAAVTMQGVDPARIQAWIGEVLQAGKPLQPNEASPMAMVNVQFLKEHAVDVDAAAVDPSASQPFDASGRAISAAYVAGAPTVYQEGDEVLLDPATASDLEARGIVKRVGVVSSRMQRNFRTLFQVMRDRASELNDQLTVAQRDLDILAESHKKLQDQQTALTEEGKRLTADSGSLQREQQLLAGYLSKLQLQSQQLKSQVSQLYQDNIRLRQELAAQQGVN
jgi:hypothetical protein